MRRATGRHFQDGQPGGVERGTYRAALAVPALLALVATGGLVPTRSGAAAKSLLALGPRTPAAPPVATSATPATAAAPTTRTTRPRTILPKSTTTRAATTTTTVVP